MTKAIALTIAIITIVTVILCPTITTTTHTHKTDDIPEVHEVATNFASTKTLHNDVWFGLFNKDVARNFTLCYALTSID